MSTQATEEKTKAKLTEEADINCSDSISMTELSMEEGKHSGDNSSRLEVVYPHNKKMFNTVLGTK